VAVTYTPNPRHGASDWEELKYDVCHWREYLGNIAATWRGENPLLSESDRRAVIGLVVVALAMVLAGLVIVVSSYA
jgi:hypothetical protein